MPPFLPRKRLRSSSPEAGPSKPPTKQQVKGNGRAKAAAPLTPRKPSLFDDLDAGTGSSKTTDHGKAILEKLAFNSDDSSLSSLSDDELEDVPLQQKEESGSEDEDVEFEDVQTHAEPVSAGPEPSGDLELTLKKDPRISLTNPLGTKKGPSKIERGIRVATHQMHVQMLMWHNALRNAWLSDKEAHEILLKQLPPTIHNEVEKWRRKSGLQLKKEEPPKIAGKSKGKKAKGKKSDPRSQRDWGEPAASLASSEVDMSHGDPLFQLLKILVTYWRQRFRITAPGLRKLGYMSLERLDAETKSFNNDEHDAELHGERIQDVAAFRERCTTLEGSRDLGAQLFTALLRAIGLETRMVASLQPVGFGWSQNEEAFEKNPRKLKKPKSAVNLDPEFSEKSEADEDEEIKQHQRPVSTTRKKAKAKVDAKAKKASTKSRRSSAKQKGNKSAPIDLSSSEAEELESTNEDDDSIIDVTPAKNYTKPSIPYDKDLLYPHYWSEVLSPVTNTFTPVDAIITHTIATNAELLEKFEPRGGKADKAKQVTAYIVGHSPDGTAKDVTTRYLKRHMWPGRTKGNRLPVEKIPVHNKYGKVKYYEQYDWFKTVMSGYSRGSAKCPRTEIDDLEEATILKPVKPEKKEVEEGKETLQSYKASREFVLERHLKREEALLPGAKHVKMFSIKGKGDDTVEEKVFLRKDVVHCKTMETWHKEGRAPIDGEQPLKRVPYRAATTNRRRELLEAEQAAGEKVLQGLYSRDQTDWIIPPPIENGIIPKNNFGNIDLYVDSMLPAGAAHIPRRGTVKICKRLGIDYAEAVTGFEFGHRMAVPIITGVVVAEEHLDAVMEQWEQDEAERVRKEDEKRTKLAIGMWRKMLMGMRIIARVRAEYGDEVDDHPDELNPWTNKNKRKAADRDVDTEAQAELMNQRDEEMAGGFFPEGYNVEDEEEGNTGRGSSFLPLDHDDDDEDEGGGFIMEENEQHVAVKGSTSHAYPTPQSLESSKAAVAASIFQEEEEDQEMLDADLEHEGEELLPPPRKRGRPAIKSVTTPKPKSKPTPKPRGRPPAKNQQQPAPPSKPTPRNRKVAAETTDEDNTGEESSLSDPNSEQGSSEEEEEEEEDEEERPTKGTAKNRRASNPARQSTASVRKMPRRRAAAAAVRSRYFEHSGSGEEDD